ncbi:MAG: hypothetical protein ABIQ07_02335, partial [Ginsengibacter sp.]
MKNIFIGLSIFAISLSACNSGDKTDGTKNKNTDSTQANSQTKNETTKGTASMKAIVDGYLQLKNSLANDNGKDAASAG